MKGDSIVVEDYHRSAAKAIVQQIGDRALNHPSRYVITIAGEAGSGKSETASAVADALRDIGVESVILGQDDYFVEPPKTNDTHRRRDSSWLGPHCEVRIDLLQEHLDSAVAGAESLVKPVIDYDADAIEEETISLSGVGAVIAEGTYTSLLRNVDVRVFITRTRLQTLAHRKKRDRGSEASDPFVESVLEREHTIIAGHRYLADILIADDYKVTIRL